MSNNLLTELVCTRISHDIVGNIGVVANAVELLEEGDMDYIKDITNLLKAGSQTLSSRMKFFRMAFGLDSANIEDENVVKQTIEDYLKTLGNKDFPIVLEWFPVSLKHRKHAMIMIMLACDILIRGGQLNLRETNEALTVEIAEGARFSSEKFSKIEQSLTSGQIEMNAALAPLAVLAAEGRLSVIRNDEKILFTLE